MHQNLVLDIIGGKVSMNNLIILSGQKGSGKSTCGSFLAKNYGYHQMSFASRLKDIVAWVYDLPRDRLDGITEEDRAWREQLHSNLKSNWDRLDGITEEDRAWREQLHSNLKSNWDRYEETINSGFRKRHEYLWIANLSNVLEMIYGSQKPNPVLNGISYSDLQSLISYLLKKHIYPYDLSPRQALQIIGTEVFRAIHPDTWCLALQVQIEELRKLDPDCKIVVTDGRFENEALWGKNQDALLIYVDRAIEDFDLHSSEDTAKFKELADIVLLNKQGLDELEDSLLTLVACSKKLNNKQFMEV